VTEFKKGDKVSVFDDPKDIAIVGGVSEDYKDNQGNPLINLETIDGKPDCSISPQVLKKLEE
jgi:hypothetical protein